MEEQVERAFEDRCRYFVRHDLILSERGAARRSQITGPNHKIVVLVITRENTPAPVVCAVVARVFSGIQPTGEMHLGNYLGAVRRWVDDQPAAGSEAAANHDAVFLRRRSPRAHVALRPGRAHGGQPAGSRRCCWPRGLDPERCLLFVQSHVRAHAELTWLLNCSATFGSSAG